MLMNILCKIELLDDVIVDALDGVVIAGEELGVELPGFGLPVAAELDPPSGFGLPVAAELDPPSGFGLPVDVELDPPSGFGLPVDVELDPPSGFGLPVAAELDPPSGFGLPVDVELDSPSGFVVCFSCSVMINASAIEERSRFSTVSACLTLSSVSALLH